MPRIQECLSLGTRVVSESAQDQDDYPDLQDAVIFFDEGNVDAMIATVRAELNRNETEVAKRTAAINQAALRGQENFAFMFDRFLIAQGFLEISHALDIYMPVNFSSARVALSMPETISRRRLFEAKKPKGCAIFNGMRMRPGWVGCGLSYSLLARSALESAASRDISTHVTIMEDDVILPEDFEPQMAVVHEYLDSLDGQWDVFSGLIAVVHPEVKVLDVATYKGICFATIDRMISMVCNVYNQSALKILSRWDPENQDDQNNTIDKYIEAQTSLRVVVALPFLVGHREEVQSTLWGFHNSRYSSMIAKAEEQLLEKVHLFMSESTA
jgi:hypothetical protein